MSSILVGSAFWTARLEFQQLTQGVAAVEQQIARLQALSKQPITFTARGQVSPASGAGPAGGAGGSSSGGSGGSGGDGVARYDRLQRAQAGLLAQEARLARAQGDTAKAADLEAQAQLRLTTVLEGQSGATVQSIAIQKQLVGIQTQGARAAQAQSAEAQKTGEGLGALRNAALLAGGAFAAIRIGQQVGEYAAYGAKINDTRASFEGLTAAANVTSTALLGRLRQAAHGSISDAQLMQSANTGLLLTSGAIASKLPQLIEIARASARATGQDIGFVYDSLVRGIARGSPKIIDNAGITLDAAAAFETYARSIGKSSDTLTSADQQQATLNAVLETGAQIIKDTGAAAGSQADNYTRLTVALTNLKDRGAGIAGTVFAPAAEGLQNILSVTEGTAEGFGNAAVSINNFSRHLTGLPQLTEAQAKATYNAAESFAAWLGYTVPLTAEQQKLAAVEEDRASREPGYTVNIQQMTQAQLGYANALEMTGVQARAAAVVQQQKADADQVANVNNQTAAIAQQELATQAQLAAKALLQTGPAGARTADMLAGSSQQVDILTAAYFRLYTAQQNVKAGGAAAGLADKFGGGAGGTLKEEQDAIIKAQQQQILATGTTAQRIALLKKLYADAVKEYGKGSSEAITAQTQLISAQQAAAREGQRLAKSHTSELNKQLTLEEGIRDSKEKQLKASLDAQAAVIRDRQERRKEDQEIRAAQRILASGRASGEFRAAAADRLALIGIERQQRALAISEQQATAGASIVNGRLIQSRPGAGRSPSLVGGGGAVPGDTAVPSPAAVQSGLGGMNVDVAVYLDSTQIAAKVVTTLREGHAAVPSAGVGQAVPAGG